MIIDIIDEQEDLALDEGLLQRIAAAVIANEGVAVDEVAIYFVDKEEISDLHGRFFDDPTPTDCISFPLDDDEEEHYRHLGEVFVCPAVASEYVQQHGGDPWRETVLYMTHGLLHLMGYDDIEEQDRLAMRAAEARHLALLLTQGLLEPMPEGESTG